MVQNNRILKVDIMLVKGGDEEFYATMKLPVTFDIIGKYEGDTPIFDIEKIQKALENKLPLLRRTRYRVCM